MTRVMPKTGMSKRRWPDKNTEEYSEKRAQNNVAVKRSREKSRQKKEETKMKVNGLREENSELEMRVSTLKKELDVLKGIFTAHATGSVPPPQVTSPTNPETLTTESDPVRLDHFYSGSSRS